MPGATPPRPRTQRAAFRSADSL